MTDKHGHILVVDDNRVNRLKLSRGLEQQGYTVALAENGQRALEMIQAQSFDLVLLDIVMPKMNGYQVLERMKRCSALRDIPVIVVSALDEMEGVVRCIEMGAEDYLPKPFDPVLLKARIGACLEKKWLRDQEHAYLEQLQMEQEKSERLLLNILPKPIADRLKQGQSVIADSFDDVTVLFADIVDFTRLSAQMSPTELVVLLNEIFSTFDRLAEQHGLEKIKTIGDAYMVVGGLPTPRPDHAEAIAEMALDMQKEIQFKAENGEPLRIRIGIHTGPVVAGIIGTRKFSYDLWGDTVNTASRMESHGLSGGIQVTATTYECLRDKYLFEKRGMIQVKSKGEMMTYLLLGRKTD
jgi:adenylate cyclase